MSWFNKITFICFMSSILLFSDALILERLAVYSKDSVDVFASTDKTKEALEGKTPISKTGEKFLYINKTPTFSGQILLYII